MNNHAPSNYLHNHVKRDFNDSLKILLELATSSRSPETVARIAELLFHKEILFNYSNGLIYWYLATGIHLNVPTRELILVTKSN